MGAGLVARMRTGPAVSIAATAEFRPSKRLRAHLPQSLLLSYSRRSLLSASQPCVRLQKWCRPGSSRHQRRPPSTCNKPTVRPAPAMLAEIPTPRETSCPAEVMYMHAWYDGRITLDSRHVYYIAQTLLPLPRRCCRTALPPFSPPPPPWPRSNA